MTARPLDGFFSWLPDCVLEMIERGPSAARLVMPAEPVKHFGNLILLLICVPAFVSLSSRCSFLCARDLKQCRRIGGCWAPRAPPPAIGFQHFISRQWLGAGCVLASQICSRHFRGGGGFCGRQQALVPPSRISNLGSTRGPLVSVKLATRLLLGCDSF